MKRGIAICTPIPNEWGPLGWRLAPVTTEFHRARSRLATPTNHSHIDIYEDGKPVDEARNHAVKVAKENDCEFIFFLDYDVLPQFDAITKLVYRAKCFPDRDIFAGVYCCKSSPPEPLIYEEKSSGPYWDWTLNDLLFNIRGVHMGLTLIRMSIFDKLEHTDDNPWFLTTDRTEIIGGNTRRHRGTEDLHFCFNRVEEELGDDRILVDTSVLAGHIDHKSGKIFGLPLDSPPYLRAKWHPGNEDKEPEKKALDIGAGKERREWPDHKTYTTDIRPDVGADYVMDSRLLNLPDNHFDLVASSHHLEHIGRWEQEQVWSEMFRICKPGGKIEHIVPNIDWAARKIFDGDTDEHVLNVLYGAQETHGYERIYNTHFFGYTKGIAKELAEAAGFVNVACEDWRDRPELGYNLVIRGEKPDGLDPDEVAKANEEAENGELVPLEDLLKEARELTKEEIEKARELLPEVEAIEKKYGPMNRGSLEQRAKESLERLKEYHNFTGKVIDRFYEKQPCPQCKRTDLDCIPEPWGCNDPDSYASKHQTAEPTIDKETTEP